MSVSRVSLFALIKKFKKIKLVVDLKRKPRSSILEECHYRFIDEAMAANNELTSRHLQTVVKPKNLQELKDGIKKFWLTLTPAVCAKYVGHLKKVIPKVIEENGT